MTVVASRISPPFAEANRSGASSPEPVPAAPVVFIHDLIAQATIGVYENERTQPMSLRLDLEIELPSSRAGETDQLSDTIDYGAVVDAIRSRLATTQCRLLERLAEVVAALVLDEFGARRVSVQIAKTGMFRGVGRVGVRIERWRSAVARRI